MIELLTQYSQLVFVNFLIEPMGLVGFTPIELNRLAFFVIFSQNILDNFDVLQFGSQP